jgi:DNA invertase Pin-like site-specific DNA recombinase
MSANNSSVRAACLYRNSDDKQENSVDRQRDGVVPYANRKGYDIVAEYVFDGIPGDEIKFHPDWKRLLKDAGGKWSVLLMDEPSRLSRDDPDEFVAEVKLPLKKAGVRPDSVTKGLLDWDTIAGDILTIVHAHKAREEVRDLSRRTLGGVARRAREGLWFGWRCPYGLRVQRTIEPETGKVTDRKVVFGPEEEVRVVRFIFDAIANRGWSLRRVCRELDARGVKPPLPNGRRKSAERWCTRTIRKFLQNRKYIGDMPWNVLYRGKYSAYRDGAVEQVNGSSRQIHRHDEENWVIVPDLIPPLIDRDTFTRAAAVLVASQKRTNPGNGMNYLFTHALVCGDCGAFLRGWPDRHSGAKAYICANYKEYGSKACHRNIVLEKPLLDSIIARLLDDVLDPARLDAIEAEMVRQLEAERDAGGVERLKKQIGALERDIAQGNVNLLRLPEDRLAGAVAALRGLEAERNALAARLKELEDGAGQQQAILDEARRQLWRLRESLEGNDEEAQVTVIREVLSKIEVRFEHSKQGKTKNRPAGAVLYVRPGLGLSCLSTTAS